MGYFGAAELDHADGRAFRISGTLRVSGAQLLASASLLESPHLGLKVGHMNGRRSSSERPAAVPRTSGTKARRESARGAHLPQVCPLRGEE
jgi:hypothetical protein